MTGSATRTARRLVRWQVTPVHLMLALTFTTGVVDAVGYLRLDQVFAGNMTGNVVILGMAAVGDTGLPVLGPAVALVSFLAGAAAAGRALRTAAPGWSRLHTALLGGVDLLLAATALGVAVIGTGAAATRAVLAAALALAMGVQAATARHLAVKDVTTVVVTSTLTGLAADSRLGAGRRQGAKRRVAVVALLVVGAVAGAALCQAHAGIAVAAAAVVVLVVSGLGHASVRSADDSTTRTAGVSHTRNRPEGPS
ncbi:YoaK family protein [Lentzea sp. NEAU-D7]|uniref:YoaK family protein n=1 Tax=Lentzea sp. NEAU-D7 TaxID=2994667 RepID=UPI00224AC6D6|nr:YoaK family protein [Lentzea sp. NEAU-D7]MCX2951175.1 YoaK family protein [Lentzea sp. NEAU-D7]